MAKKCLSCVKTLASQSQAETDSLCKFGNPDNAACMRDEGKTSDAIFTRNRKLNVLRHTFKSLKSAFPLMLHSISSHI